MIRGLIYVLDEGQQSRNRTEEQVDSQNRLDVRLVKRAILG